MNEEWVDETGELVQGPAEQASEERIVTVVEDGGVPVAALAHDPAALRDETLARSVAAAVRMMRLGLRLSAVMNVPLWQAETISTVGTPPQPASSARSSDDGDNSVRLARRKKPLCSP